MAKMARNIVLGVVGAGGLLFVIGALFGPTSGVPQQPTPSASASSGSADVAIKVSAKQLSAAFQENEAKAKLAYDGQQLLVNGTVKDIDLDFGDDPVIKLRGAGEQYGVGVNADGKLTDVQVMGSPVLNDCSLQ